MCCLLAFFLKIFVVMAHYQDVVVNSNVELGATINVSTTESLNESLFLNDTAMGHHAFIFSPYAYGISGVFAFSGLLVTCFQVS